MPEKIDFHLDTWPALMSETMAAAYLDCSPRTVAKLLAQSQLVPTKTHFGKRYRRTELDRYIASLPEWQA
ncbi:helix-turn-helix domain-containing protein [Changpingibacter yushuensis]|uniref:helix-turn-helix domain-containing protein n=1 Tax=Changpingibacter yushuensis TaxID=2758440 RepID=UPI00165E3D1A|nr:helix-turn-helix domain-containing protein [Changpingibacter yushuensis]